MFCGATHLSDSTSVLFAIHICHVYFCLKILQDLISFVKKNLHFKERP